MATGIPFEINTISHTHIKYIHSLSYSLSELAWVRHWSSVAALTTGPTLSWFVVVSLVFLVMVRGRIADATTTGAVPTLCQEFPDESEGVHSESYLSEKNGLEGGEGNDAEEERNKSGQLQLKEEKDGEELLDLLLLLATGWKKRLISFNNNNDYNI